MKSEKNILIAFLLNLCFSIFEILGGLFTNSIAIVSDAIHDFGDSISIGLSYFLERKSKRKPDNKYTYGYIRYSLLGGIITNTILMVGSILVIYNAVLRIINQEVINYDGMIIFSVIGIIVNFLAAYFTREGDSLNQKSVNLHMLEDVLGWIVVFIGAIIMKFTNISIIDSILSILVALFIFVNATKNFKEIVDLFLEKTPHGIDILKLKEHLLKIDKVRDIHHIHVWSIDGYHSYATMHVVTDGDNKKVKELVKEELKEHGISHTTIELENIDEVCVDDECKVNDVYMGHGHHHH